MAIADLIEATHGAAAAQQYRQTVPDRNACDALIAVAKEALVALPPVPGACLLMSALIASRTADMTSYPTYVVAGSLAVGRVRIFGQDTLTNGSELFSQDHPSWDGHAWVVFGPHIAEASLFRTAYSGRSHPTLAAFVREKYGPGRGLMLTTPGQAEQDGLSYQPQYVLSSDQVDGLTLGALSLLRPPDEEPA